MHIVIRVNMDWTTSTDRLTVLQAVPANVQHGTMQTQTWQTWLRTHTSTTNRQDDKHISKITKIKRRLTTDFTTENTRTQTQTPRTIEPQVPAASPTHAAKPEKQRYMASIQHQKKVTFQSQSGWWVRMSRTPKENGQYMQRETKTSTLVYHFSESALRQVQPSHKLNMCCNFSCIKFKVLKYIFLSR